VIPGVLVFGHGPEGDVPHAINRLPAFAWCRDLGADGVECDVRLSADGELVVVHDDSLADGRPVAACRRDELPAWIPSLGAVLDACAGLVVNVELKNFPRDPGFDPDQRVTHRLLELLVERDGRDDVLVSCFDTGAIDVVQASSDLNTALLLLSRRPADELLDRAVRHGHPVVHPYDTMVDDAFMDAARARELTVNVWFGGAVGAGRFRELVDLGVDGLITDEVAAAREVVDRRQA
jgi:glycerophosphoryl diester phosphodiesterase